MKVDLSEYEEELLEFVFEKALNALSKDVSNFTPMTRASDKLRHSLVHLMNDLIALRGKLYV